MLGADEPIRVLRVIARLNVGGPSLHVSYLTEGLAVARLRDDARGRRDLGGRGVDGVRRRAARASRCARARAPARGLAARATRRPSGARRADPEERPHVLHTHTAKAGAVGRSRPGSPAATAPPVVVHTFHGHTLAGYFGPAKRARLPPIERALARETDALVAVSPEVRDELVEIGVAPASQLRGRPARHRALRAHGRAPSAATSSAPRSASRRSGSRSAGSAG